jgi:glutamate synthase domain-containing protein 3
MVGLEPLAEADDIDVVRDLLIQHAGYTGSTVAARLLSDWESAVERFVKVMPLDYRRVLDERKRLEDEAREVVEQEQQVEVARG